eukprot:GHVU01229397.1.p1 GENE.GHVU01229397.1~~GHVU01229397.1.p1  ORF type:complete len:152 (+),score=19.12 GHVU01229397.1:96-551(+)
MWSTHRLTLFASSSVALQRSSSLRLSSPSPLLPPVKRFTSPRATADCCGLFLRLPLLLPSVASPVPLESISWTICVPARPSTSPDEDASAGDADMGSCSAAALPPLAMIPVAAAAAAAAVVTPCRYKDASEAGSDVDRRVDNTDLEYPQQP